MRCHQVETQMFAYVDGQLPADVADKVETHLDVCPLCRRLYEREVELVAVFSAPTRGLAGEGFAAAVRRRIEQDREKAPVSRSEPVRVRPWLGLAIAAVGLATVLTLWLLGRPAEPFGDAWPLLGRAQLVWEAWQQVVVAMLARGADAASAGQSGWSVVAGQAASHATVIALATAAAVAACVALVAATRRKLGKESKT